MVRALLFGFALSGLGAAAPAQQPAPRPDPAPEPSPRPAPRPAPTPPKSEGRKAERFKYFTELGDTVINECDAIVTGRVARVTNLPGAAVVEIAVATWPYGDHAEGESSVTLLAHLDDFFAGTELLLFLKRFEDGPRYTYINRVLRSDPEYDAKLRVLTQTLALRDWKEAEDRRRQVRKLIFDDCEARESWTRWHALAELLYVRRTYPDLVTKEDVADLRAIAARSDDARFRKALLEALAPKLKEKGKEKVP
jgi:hypothetical protein